MVKRNLALFYFSLLISPSKILWKKEKCKRGKKPQKDAALSSPSSLSPEPVQARPGTPSLALLLPRTEGDRRRFHPITERAVASWPPPRASSPPFHLYKAEARAS